MHDKIKEVKKKAKKKTKKSVKDRKRKVDIDSISDEQLANIEAQISEKIKEITTKAVNDANKILNIYGIEAYMQVSMKPMKGK